MAQAFGSQIDLQKIPVKGLVAEQVASPGPTSPVNGQLWYDTTNNVTKCYDNGAWVLVGNTTGGSTPSGPAGGDLTGSTYPNPTIATGAVTSAKILDATILLSDLAASATDQAAGTASLRTLGTGAAQAAAGNDSRLSDSRAPNGVAGGSLTGSYPNPTVAALAITDGMVAAANKDGVAGTYSLRTLGTGAQQAAAGNDTRFTDARTPSGAAGGDLTGSTYPNPVIAGLAVTAAKIALATITDAQIAAANKDGAVGTLSLRTLGSGAAQAMPGNRTLDAITAPVASLNLNTQKIIGLVDPTNPQEAATKAYVDSIAQGLDPKGSVRAATTANIALTGTQTIDTIAVIAGDRVLVKDQSTPANNGIYVVAAGAWARATDMDVWAEVPSAFTFVEEGSANVDSGWVSTANQGGTLNTTAITWTQFSGAGSITAGGGLTKTGNTLDVIGTAARILVNADNIDIDSGYVGQASITTLGTIGTGTWNGTAISMAKGGTGGTDAATARTSLGAAGKFSGLVGALAAGVETLVTHSLGTQDIVPSFRDATTQNGIEFAWRAASTTQIGITADIAYAANAIRVVVIG